ncbi:alpha/beta fold hydrolase [Marinactinospora rubrisoli]|uniref:Alpha/beta fold hydrolase n=1 Tax=Marinactinospora rubrisoli TaxID=2715399 RepID=A0ABW2KAI3_9ACTN
MLDGFRTTRIDTGEAEIAVAVAGSGPPLLLLHGFPQTHVMWHRVAPALSEDFTVVLSDLRGYGASSRPPATAGHQPYSKRAMARDQVEVMRRLGFPAFAVAGHDRGGRCAYRMALDHPERVRALAVLDIVPTLDAYERVDADLAHGLWRWFLMAQRHPIPERIIAADPETFFFGTGAEVFAPEALAAYRSAVARPGAVQAMCEDYRAASTIDRANDAADLGRRRIRCPVLALWGAHSTVHAWYDVLAVWRRWADDVRGAALDSGHFLAEEAPEATTRHLRAFLTATARPPMPDTSGGR